MAARATGGNPGDQAGTPRPDPRPAEAMTGPFAPPPNAPGRVNSRKAAPASARPHPRAGASALSVLRSARRRDRPIKRPPRAVGSAHPRSGAGLTLWQERRGSFEPKCGHSLFVLSSLSMREAPMSDGSIFNVPDRGNFLCPVCGFPYSKQPAYDEAGGLIGVTICPCCLWEPGFDDDPGAAAHAQPSVGASVREYRERWFTAPQWRGMPERKPKDLNLDAQRARLRQLAPFLFEL